MVRFTPGRFIHRERIPGKHWQGPEWRVCFGEERISCHLPGIESRSVHSTDTTHVLIIVGVMSLLCQFPVGNAVNGPEMRVVKLHL